MAKLLNPPAPQKSPSNEGTTAPEGKGPSQPRKRRQKFPASLAALAVVAAATWVGVSWTTVTPVTLVPPRLTTAMETLAASGVVYGRTETTIGADTQGTLVELWVDENDRVKKGQLLARVQNRVAQGQVSQTEAVVGRARAQLRQAQAGATASEIAAAQARVAQMEDGFRRAELAVERSTIAIAECEASIRTAESARARASASETQARSRRELALKSLERTRHLVQEGALAVARLDEAQTAFDVATSTVVDASAAVMGAEAQIKEAELARKAADIAVAQSKSDLNAARSALDGARADLDQLRSLPRPEGITVAKAAVQEAEAARKAAQSLILNADIRAPVDGTVTEVLCRPGGMVGVQGVVRLVETGRLEAKADVDESNLGRLRLGQRALLATSDQPERQIEARITRIGSHVESSRGTVDVVAVPNSSQATLRPGQTVDITIVLTEKARRLLVPTSAIRRKGDQTVVFVVRDGRAVARSVRAGQASEREIAILSGIDARDTIVCDAGTLEDGKRVRVER